MLNPATEELISLCCLQRAESRKAATDEEAANACIKKVEDEAQLAVEGGVDHLGDRRLCGRGA
jgi:hypothetical protein